MSATRKSGRAAMCVWQKRNKADDEERYPSFCLGMGKPCGDQGRWCYPDGSRQLDGCADSQR